MIETINKEKFGALVCSLSAFLFYFLSLAPTVQGFDSAELTMGAYDLGFVHPPGYPLYLTIGHLFSKIPFENIGFRLNLMSAFFSSLTIYILYRLLFKQTRIFWITTIFTVLFATSPLYWSQSIRAEVYTFHTFLTTTSLLTWYIGNFRKEKFFIYFSFIVLGISAGNHPTTILLWIAITVVSIKINFFTFTNLLFANILTFFSGSIWYLYFPLRANSALLIDYIRPYFQVDLSNLSGIIWMISGKPFQCLLLQSETNSLSLEALRLLDFIWTGSLGFGIFFAIWGWFELNKKFTLWNQLLSIYLLTNLFSFLIYKAIDKEVMFLPVIILTMIWASNGVDPFVNWFSSVQKQLDQTSIIFLLKTSLISIMMLAIISDFQNISLKNDRRVYEYTKNLVIESNPDSLIANHWATASVIDYLQIVEKVRPDVKNINVDFYFLGLQENCNPPSNQDLIKNGWISKLYNLSKMNRLCYIEPLHDLPDEYNWSKNGLCWQIIKTDQK